MDSQRRRIIRMASLMPAMALAPRLSADTVKTAVTDRLVLSKFDTDEPIVMDGASWRGFSDRVMGGVSNANLTQDTVGGRSCIRLTGNVTRDNGGGFIQMALYLPRSNGGFDASNYKGVELLVHGNDEAYNAHIRTADAGWHDQSYRATFEAESRWQTVRLPWSAFEAHRMPASMDTTRILRLGLLGWMREFDADLALGEVALYT